MKQVNTLPEFMAETEKIKIKGFRLDKESLYNILAYVYLGAFIFISIFYEFSLPLFIVFFLATAFFIIPSNFGLGLIIVLTMIFERFFTLQPLVIDWNVYKIYPLDIVIGMTFLSWLLRFRFSGTRPKLFFNWPERILLGFVILNVFYLIYSFYDLSSDFKVAFSTFKNYAFYPLLYFLTVFSVQNKERLKKICHYLLYGSAIIVIFIIIGLVRGQGLWTEFTPLSTAGVRLLAGTHAFYLLLAVILIFSLIIYKRFKSNLLPGILLWIWIVGILLSLMRHLWLALILGVILLFILIPKKFKKSFKIYTIKNGLIISSLILVYVLAVNLYPYQSFESRLFSSTENIQTRMVSITKTAMDTSINWRIALWSSALKIWMKNPVIGVGFGREIFLEVGDWQTYEEIRNLHNSSLAILTQMGILGLALFYGFSASVIWLSRKYLWFDEKLSPYYISLAVCAVLFVFVSLFQPYFETNLFAIFFWIIMGLLRSGELIFKNKNKI